MADNPKSGAERLASLLEAYKDNPMGLVPHMREIAEGVMDAVKRLEALEGKTPEEGRRTLFAGGPAVQGAKQAFAAEPDNPANPTPAGSRVPAEGKAAGHHPGRPRTHYPEGDGEV
jgi:hypothetical protein